MISNYSQRILVIGSPGAGKTTWSKRLSQTTKIPVFHLDDYYWLKQWERIDPIKWQNILVQLCEKPHWIIDGNHLNTFESRLKYADLVIMLDCSVFVSFFSFCKRSLQRLFFNDEHLPLHIKNDTLYKPRVSIEWRLIKLIILFKIKTKPRMLEIIKQHNVNFYTLPNRKAYQTLLEKIANDSIPEGAL